MKASITSRSGISSSVFGYWVYRMELLAASTTFHGGISRADSFQITEYAFLLVRSLNISAEDRSLNDVDRVPVQYAASTNFRRRSFLFDSMSKAFSVSFLRIIVIGALKY